MDKMFVLPLLFLVVSCSLDKNKSLKTSDENPFINAQWITHQYIPPKHDSLLYQNQSAPVFRKGFNVTEEIDSAILYITSAGYYKAFVNGEQIEDNILDPAWTDFSKRIYFTGYDITDKLKQGPNCLGITLGNGFYNPLPLKMWGNLNLREKLTIGQPSVIAKLVIKQSDGQIKEITTNETWKYTHGPIIKNNVYLGEVYNANHEIVNWQEPEYNDSSWEKSVITEGPGGKLQKSFFPPIRITNRIKPRNITSPMSDIYLVDMGINFTGTYRIKLKGIKGDTIQFRFGERIYEDGTLNPMTTVVGQIKRKGTGGPGAPDIAWQADSYIFGNDSIIWYSPSFTFHTYRYMEIEGLNYKPDIQDVKGLAFNSDVDNENHVSSSSNLLNSIQQATVRTFTSNLIGVQSDCPAREKFGYGGDLNATSESFIYNFDMQSFYRKTIYDWIDAINLKDSSFIDTAPYVGINYCGISWESAFLTTQWYLYLYYGDLEIVKSLYEFDSEWMDKVAKIHPEGVVHNGLSDHESLEPVPVELTGTAHYLQCAKIMKNFAQMMGDSKREKLYKRLATSLKDSIKNRFWDKTVESEINKQTLFSTLLYHDIITQEDVESARDSLLKSLKNGPSGHLSTGIFGTKYMLETLSETGNTNHVYQFVNSTQYPGWGYMIDQGATTIWETWKESDNTYSNCHPMFGTVTEWYYRWLGGIQPIASSPGFKKFLLTPHVPDGLNWIKCNYQSPFGEIISEWKKEGNNKIIFETKIPVGTSSIFKLPEFNIKKVDVIFKNTEKEFSLNKEEIVNRQFELNEGEYIITVFF